ncbi:MAG: hypothetical protein ACREJF_09095, partial [Candidatus Methylomirabilales bacterium]
MRRHLPQQFLKNKRVSNPLAPRRTFQYPGGVSREEGVPRPAPPGETWPAMMRALRNSFKTIFVPVMW